jgi:hypothetical protein
MSSRTDIDTAVGVIIAQNRCNQDEAIRDLGKAFRRVEVRNPGCGLPTRPKGLEGCQCRFRHYPRILPGLPPYPVRTLTVTKGS